MSMTWLFTDRSTKTKTPAPIALKNLRVASPCPMEWAKMTGDDRVRHCSECKLNVYNLSAMSRREAEELIVRHEGRLCVRFFRRADGTVLTRDCPVGLRQLVTKVSRVAGAVLSAVMSVNFCAAQTSPHIGQQATAQNDQQKTGIRITVTDPQGAIVSGVQVSLLLKGAKTGFSAVTNSDGVALFSGLAAGSYQMEVEAQGFKSYRQRLSLAQDKIEKIQVTLKFSEVTVGVAMVGAAPMIDKTESTVTNTFSGDLLRAGSPH